MHNKCDTSDGCLTLVVMASAFLIITGLANISKKIDIIAAAVEAKSK